MAVAVLQSERTLVGQPVTITPRCNQRASDFSNPAAVAKGGDCTVGDATGACAGLHSDGTITGVGELATAPYTPTEVSSCRCTDVQDPTNKAQVGSAHGVAFGSRTPARGSPLISARVGLLSAVVASQARGSPGVVRFGLVLFLDLLCRCRQGGGLDLQRHHVDERKANRPKGRPERGVVRKLDILDVLRGSRWEGQRADL